MNDTENSTQEFGIVCFHGTSLFLNIKNNMIRSAVCKTELLTPIIILVEEDGIFLVADIDSEKIYINRLYKDGSVELSSEKKKACNVKYVKYSINKIALLTEFGFLSARKNGSVSYQPWDREWEQFKLCRIGKKDNYDHKENNFIKLYYWNPNWNGKGNVGDLFSKYIVEKISRKKVIHGFQQNPCVALGSIIQSKILQYSGIFWGTGTHMPKVNFYPTSPQFYAVRGPLTRQILLRAGYSCPDVYGDPALFLPNFYTPGLLSKKYKIGVVGHWRHRQKIICKEGILLIDIQRREDDITSFIDELCQCEYILSSSLHGIIISNAYGIPARWFMMKGYPLEGDPYLKFRDYFMSVNMPIQEPLMLEENTVLHADMHLDINLSVDLKIDLARLESVFPF